MIQKDYTRGKEELIDLPPWAIIKKDKMEVLVIPGHRDEFDFIGYLEVNYSK